MFVYLQKKKKEKKRNNHNLQNFILYYIKEMNKIKSLLKNYIYLIYLVKNFSVLQI
jgi:hypothetical protein